MVLIAVRENLPLIVTDAEDRRHFEKTYVDLVREAFDRAAAFDRDEAAAG